MYVHVHVRVRTYYAETLSVLGHEVRQPSSGSHCADFRIDGSGNSKIHPITTTMPFNYIKDPFYDIAACLRRHGDVRTSHCLGERHRKSDVAQHPHHHGHLHHRHVARQCMPVILHTCILSIVVVVVVSREASRASCGRTRFRRLLCSQEWWLSRSW